MGARLQMSEPPPCRERRLWCKREKLFKGHKDEVAHVESEKGTRCSEIKNVLLGEILGPCLSPMSQQLAELSLPSWDIAQAQEEMDLLQILPSSKGYDFVLLNPVARFLPRSEK